VTRDARRGGPAPEQERTAAAGQRAQQEEHQQGQGDHRDQQAGVGPWGQDGERGVAVRAAHASGAGVGPEPDDGGAVWARDLGGRDAGLLGTAWGAGAAGGRGEEGGGGVEGGGWRGGLFDSGKERRGRRGLRRGVGRASSSADRFECSDCRTAKRGIITPISPKEARRRQKRAGNKVDVAEARRLRR